MAHKIKNFFKMFSSLKLKSLLKFYDLKYIKKVDNDKHRLRLKNGLEVTVDKSGGDLTTLFEVFVNEDYKFGEDSSKKINVLDIGSNVGYFSLYISKKFPNARVFAFEPFPDTYKRLSEHIEMNNLKNVKSLNYAVSDFTGTSKFYSFEWTGCNTLVEGEYDEALHKVTSVECLKFDSLREFTGAGEFEFAKIDCEGSEYPIFLNSTDEAITSVKKYIMEVHNTDKYSRGDLTKRFEKLGFKVINADNLLTAERA